MPKPTVLELKPIGRVESALTDLASAPRQADEGAPEAILITWLDRARRDVLSVHPRGDSSRKEAGVFSTRSPHRPNPIGLHRVQITAIDGPRVRVSRLEAVDGTPILDLKPILDEDIRQR